MAKGASIAALTELSRPTLGAFRGCAATAAGVSRKELTAFCRDSVISRELPDTYRMDATPRSWKQDLFLGLLWVGDAAGEGRSAGACYGLEVFSNAGPR
jgi:hypothetical protein